MSDTVYEIGAGPPFAFWHGTAFVVMGLVALWVRRNRAVRRRGILLLWGGGAIAFGGLGALVTILRHVGAYAAYRSDDVDVIEGRVHVLREQPRAGHAPGDLLEIDGRQIEVDYFGSSPGYTTTIAFGGVLREGAMVRVALRDNQILRIERIKSELP